jgi:AraC-like DNA-binding protein
MKAEKMPQELLLPADYRETLRAQLARHVTALLGSATQLQTTVPGLTLYRQTAPTEPATGTYEPSVALVIQGKKQVTLDTIDFIQSAARFLLTSVDLPVTSQVIEASTQVPYLCLRLKLDVLVVREVLGSEIDLPAWENGGGAGMTTAETTIELLDAFNRLVSLHHAPQDIGFMSSLIQREVTYRILQTPEGRRLRAIATLGDASQRTAKAIEWIKENYASPLRIDELAQIASMGVSTLHHQFRALTSMSPLQYQKRLRLNEARRRMLMDGLDASSVAFSVGYESVSQFNREYSRLFGQPPMRDVRARRLGNSGTAVLAAAYGTEVRKPL